MRYLSIKKILVITIILLFISVSVIPSTGNIVEKKPTMSTNYDGNLSGYVNDTSMNPIEGARVRVYFHETYEENYTDSTGYYNVNNIPICYCLKNCTASKNEYKTEWVLLSIVENTTYDFVLIHHKEYNGSLSGYVNDTSMNPIEGARVRVYFHDTYEENYTDSTGYYNVNNIPICYCLKNCTASKFGYKTELVELSINENTTYDFILSPNQPPNAPDIDGPTSGRVGVEYEWTIIAIDPDGDDITYYIDWGDECGGAEWHGPYPSGEEVVLTYMYTIRGTFIINAMTKDEHGAESNWTYFEVTMPRNRAFNFNFNLLGWLFERFPNAFPILRQLLGI
jgi:hypothetical protein